MRIVVDTNVVFSAMLNSNSKIAKIFLHPKSKFNFYLPMFVETQTFFSSAVLREVIFFTAMNGKVSQWSPRI
jgi:predicted nucleic acid-binding protein